MSYTQSIHAINAAQAQYYRLCDMGEHDDAIGEALAILHRLKAAHKAQFGSLTRIEGEWV